MNKFLVVVLLCFVCYTSAIRVVEQNAAKTLACCGEQSYDTTKSTCCITTVVALPGPSSTLTDVCCGNRLLSNTQTCCHADGTSASQDRPIASTSTCCGVVPQNVDTQICCGGAVFAIPTSGTLECCGARTIRSGVDICCETTTVDNNNNEVTTFTVVTNAATSGKVCCGKTAYDPTTQVCCPDVADVNARALSSNSGALICCGSSTVNTATQTCCCDDSGDCSATTGVGFECCGSRGFDSTKSICCGNNVLSNTNNNLECCAGKTFNPTTQTCCVTPTLSYTKNGIDDNDCPIYVPVVGETGNVGSIAAGSCCGSIAFDPTKSLCCFDKVLANPDGTKSCCGSTTYNPSTDVCCPSADVSYARNYPNKVGDDVACCIDKTFNPESQSCPCGVVISIAQDLTQTNKNPNVSPACCGATQYDANHKTCCEVGPYLFDLDPAMGFECCSQDAQTIFNPGYQICCQETKFKCASQPSTAPVVTLAPIPVAAKRSTKQLTKLVQCGDSCCDGQGYFQEYQLCCDGEVLDGQGVGQTSPVACCGSDTYNTQYESCCVEALNDEIPGTVNFKANYAIFDGGYFEICCTKPLLN